MGDRAFEQREGGRGRGGLHSQAMTKRKVREYSTWLKNTLVEYCGVGKGMRSTCWGRRVSLARKAAAAAALAGLEASSEARAFAAAAL